MKERLIWLSHVLSQETPLYGGDVGIDFSLRRSLAKGDSCNAGHVSFGLHSGSHVDAPNHFIATGKTVDSYVAADWIFSSVALIDVDAQAGQLLGVADLPISKIDTGIELLLLRTGFEKYRNNEKYGKKNPGLQPELADYLRRYFVKLRAIGFDFISLSSFQHREIGRIAHQSFLGKDILIFEDLALQHIRNDLARVIALPLRIQGADGAPCSIIAWETEALGESVN